MNFGQFEIHAIPVIERARCRHCRGDCLPVPNGFFEKVLFCPKCDIVYRITMIKVPEDKVPEEYLEQCKRYARKKHERA